MRDTQYIYRGGNQIFDFVDYSWDRNHRIYASVNNPVGFLVNLVVRAKTSVETAVRKLTDCNYESKANNNLFAEMRIAQT